MLYIMKRKFTALINKIMNGTAIFSIFFGIIKRLTDITGVLCFDNICINAPLSRV